MTTLITLWTICVVKSNMIHLCTCTVGNTSCRWDTKFNNLLLYLTIMWTVIISVWHKENRIHYRHLASEHRTVLCVVIFARKSPPYRRCVYVFCVVFSYHHIRMCTHTTRHEETRTYLVACSLWTVFSHRLYFVADSVMGTRSHMSITYKHTVTNVLWRLVVTGKLSVLMKPVFPICVFTRLSVWDQTNTQT